MQRQLGTEIWFWVLPWETILLSLTRSSSLISVNSLETWKPGSQKPYLFCVQVGSELQGEFRVFPLQTKIHAQEKMGIDLF
jgi:hypothetical protein